MLLNNLKLKKMKIIYVKKVLTVILNDNTVITKGDCTKELYDKVLEKSEDEQAVMKMLLPKFYEKVEEFKEKEEEIEAIKTLVEDIKTSSIITTKDKRSYILDVSDAISLPQDFVKAIISAEKENNTEIVQTYKNFWTLACLNPDAKARDNMFWFLTKWGFKLSKSGLFVAYRNANVVSKGKISATLSSELIDFVTASYVKIKTQKKSPKSFHVIITVSGYEETYCYKKIDADLSSTDTIVGVVYDLYQQINNPDEEDSSPEYTDAHSGKFKIKIGKIVSMPREDCDERQDITCSKGLHVASKSWLEKQGKTYFGTQGLMVLVNPVDVVAVPKEDSYGKMRVCAYLPIMPIKKNKFGNIIEEDIPTGFEDNFFNIQIDYKGEKNREDVGNYTITIPDSPILNIKTITQNLQDIKVLLSKKVC